MSTWNSLREYILKNYKVTIDNGDMLCLDFGIGDGRTQRVFVNHYLIGGGTESWASIDSAFGELGVVNLDRAVRLVGDMVCGGVATVGEYVTLRDAFPLANLDLNEFERPLQLITSTADRLEANLTGRDEF